MNIVQQETPAAEPTPPVPEEASELPDQVVEKTGDAVKSTGMNPRSVEDKPKMSGSVNGNEKRRLETPGVSNKTELMKKKSVPVFCRRSNKEKAY